MSEIMETISSRLEERDLLAVEINRLKKIKDIANVVYRERPFQSGALKKSLQNLGWKEQILDYRTLELIFLFLEDEKCLHSLSKKKH